MIQGKEKLGRFELFKHVNDGRTGQDADELNLKQAQARLEVRNFFFTQRIVKSWNTVPGNKKSCECYRIQSGLQKFAKRRAKCRKSTMTTSKDDDKPPASTDGPLKPPTEGLGFYLKVTSKYFLILNFKFV
jgi:hypothetical protein